MLEPQILVIFGASGDLGHRKLIPALHSLDHQARLPSPFLVLGVGRTAHTTESFRDEMVGAPAKFAIGNSSHSHARDHGFFSKLHYQQLNTESGSDYAQLSARIDSLCAEYQIPRNVIFYLAVPPGLSERIPQWIAAHGLNHEFDGFKRIVVEKPFGHDLASAQALNRNLLVHWTEQQVYRIDHYLVSERKPLTI